ncbi:MAG TPA: DUF488 family protein [Chloroflexota bacterium]|nr:DUF488 family protein [Chloroflexota bacterium]
MIRVKRAQDLPEDDDGLRVLVDRYRPRGLSETAARIDEWCLDLAPSPALIAWYGRKPERWEEFASRYLAELSRPEAAAALTRLRTIAEVESVTLLSGARDREHNPARVLARHLQPSLSPQLPRLGVRPSPPPVWRRIHLSAILEWSWLFAGLAVPLLVLALGAVLIGWRWRGALVVGGVLAVLSGATVIHSALQERRARLALGALPEARDGAESIWVPVRELGVAASGFLIGILVFAAAVAAIGGLGRHLH